MLYNRKILTFCNPAGGYINCARQFFLSQNYLHNFLTSSTVFCAIDAICSSETPAFHMERIISLLPSSFPIRSPSSLPIRSPSSLPILVALWSCAYLSLLYFNLVSYSRRFFSSALSLSSSSYASPKYSSCFAISFNSFRLFALRNRIHLMIPSSF